MSETSEQQDDTWRPACSVQALKLRAKMLQAFREFFAKEDYLEVETPLLSSDVVVDAHIDPFCVVDSSGRNKFLQTSPEAAMKRLLAAGSGSIFQITHSFRQGERGDRHNPEFTIVEWYGVGESYFDQMRFTERLVRYVAEYAAGHGLVNQSSGIMTMLQRPFERVSYEDAFRRTLSCSALDSSTSQLQAALSERDISVATTEPFDARDDLLNFMLAQFIEPVLGSKQPEFLHNYPVSQAALARSCPHDPRTARRFELYVNGVELCNGYEELTDADELSRRQSEQNCLRTEHASNELPGADRMEAAMRSGLPPCSGVAFGFDRLVMLLGGYEKIDDVIPFPIERA